MAALSAVTKTRVDKIDIPADRLRALDDDWAMGVAQSMAVNGQQSPIIVSKAVRGRHKLIAGLHRLTAARHLEWAEIDAMVFQGGALEARLLEIDENLIRRELSALDRASHLAERRRIYEELYPDTARGNAGAAARWGYATDKLSFASETAARLGISERDVQRSIARHTRIAPDVRAKIALTAIATRGAELDALARLEPEAQRRAVDMVLAGEARSVAAAAIVISGARTAPLSPEDVEFDRLVSAWKRAGARARERFLTDIVRRDA
ncbi:ParB N-terminal domain-containing protein [Segnochrobactrum spirostomi]|nr:ParB N-terminal domain-containing protein [Segnochrobactrum spirostomi]